MIGPIPAQLTAKQIAAKLTAIGFSAPQSEWLSLLYTNQLAIANALNDQGVELPESIINQLDGFDPEDVAPIEGIIQ